MGLVWDLDLPHSKQLVLLAMADHADHKGENVFASIGLIAWKTGYSERQVQRIVHECERDGLLEKTAEATARRPATYRIVVSKGQQKTAYQGCQNVTPEADKPSPNVTPGVTKSQARGDIVASPEPYEPPTQPSDQKTPVVSGPRESQPELDFELQLMLYAILDTTGRDYHRVPAVITFARSWQADGYSAEDVAFAYQQLRQNDWKWTDPKRGNRGRKATLEDINEALGQSRTEMHKYNPDAELETTLRRVRQTGDFSAIDPDYVPELEAGSKMALSAEGVSNER